MGLESVAWYGGEVTCGWWVCGGRAIWGSGCAGLHIIGICHVEVDSVSSEIQNFEKYMTLKYNVKTYGQEKLSEI